MLARRVALVGTLVFGCIQFEGGSGGGSASDGATPEPPEPPPPAANCDPLAQDCPDGQACALFSNKFECVTVTVDGAEGDACVVAAECGPGLACIPGIYVPGCEGASCCASFCAVSDAGAECPEGAVCSPALSGPDVPPALQDYGVCELEG